MNAAKSYIWTVWHWDFQVAIGFGLFTALAAVHGDVRSQGVTILIAETAIGAGFLAVVLSAMAVFVTFFDKAYRTVLERAHDGNLMEALHPYILVAFVAAGACLSGLITALAWPALGPWVAGGLLAWSTFLMAWTVLGSASLVRLTAWHGTQRAKLMGVVEQAGEARARAAAQARSRSRT